MKVNYNISAIIANNQLKRTENRLTASTERLSSGYKINSAKDDPAGLAISKKLREQIRGLERASLNSQDAISALQTAEGAVDEINSILQRMRELTVKAKNETYAFEDKKAIQDEIDSLTKEVDRLVTDTQFNDKSLLDGNLSYRGFTDSPSVKVSAYSKDVVANDYGITITGAPKAAVLKGTALSLPSAITPNLAGKLTINGVEVEINEGDTPEEVFTKLRDTAKIADINLFTIDPSETPKNTYTDANRESIGYTQTAFGTAGNGLLFVSEEYGSTAKIEIKTENMQLLTALGLDSLDPEGDGEILAAGADASVSLDSGFTATATFKADGENVTITDRSGFEMKLEVSADAVSRIDDAPTVLSNKVNVQASGMGSMLFQVGARENQTIEVIIPDISVKALGLGNLNMLYSGGLDTALDDIDNALSKVNEVRSIIGAYQNRFESTTSSLEETTLNLEESFSRIMDTDMAEEMTNYTKENVLTQASTAMLAQANDRPQQVLQLLS